MGYKKCLVESCGKTNKKCPTIRYKKFPKVNSPLFKAWCDALNLTTIPKDNSLVCDNHFSTLDFSNNNKLKRFAIPTISPLNVTKAATDKKYTKTKLSLEDNKTEVEVKQYKTYQRAKKNCLKKNNFVKTFITTTSKPNKQTEEDFENTLTLKEDIEMLLEIRPNSAFE